MIAGLAGKSVANKLIERGLFLFPVLFSEFAALDSTAKELGLGENIAVKLNRGSRISGRQERYMIGTDKQLELEIPSILSGVDKLLSKYQHIYIAEYSSTQR